MENGPFLVEGFEGIIGFEGVLLGFVVEEADEMETELRMVGTNWGRGGHCA